MRSNELNRLVSYSNPHLFTLDLRSHIEERKLLTCLGNNSRIWLDTIGCSRLKNTIRKIIMRISR